MFYKFQVDSKRYSHYNILVPSVNWSFKDLGLQYE